MRVLALVPAVYDTTPGQRFRIEQWEPLLRAEGVEIDFQPFECKELHTLLHKPGATRRKLSLLAAAMRRRAALLRRVKRYDAVYVFREAALFGPPAFEWLVRRSGVPMVFDFDDAVFVPYKSPTNGHLSLLKSPGKTKSICRWSAHVMAGNPFLADYAGQVNDRVTIVPTTIDTTRYLPPSGKQDESLPTIGWSGSFSTVQHLDTVRPVLSLIAQTERFRLRVIGTPQYSLEGLEVEAMPWRSETEIQDLSAIDIGIMPLPDDVWSKGKCGLKALQYMALAIPTVCSPVGVNTDIIQHGHNGLLAANEDEWVDCLRQLIRSARMRRELGQAGRETVEREYSAEAQAPRVFRVFQSVCGAKGNREAALEPAQAR